MNTDYKLKFAHELQVNINQNVFSFKRHTLLLLIRDFITFKGACVSRVIKACKDQGTYGAKAREMRKQEGAKARRYVRHEGTEGT